MTDLEERIREALKDPRRQLPAWPDPMRRIRRAARRQRTIGIAVIAAAAAVVAPAAVISGLASHPTSQHGHRPAAHIPSPPPSGLFIPSSGWSGPTPAWARRLHGEVAYSCGDTICMMNANGRASRIMAATYPAADPAWSPNGRDLAFRGYYGFGDGQYDLYAIDVKGCHLARLTHQMNGTSPSWSPDGRRIAFSIPADLYVINANGTGLRRLTGGTQKYSYSDDTPTWSVRNRIAYARYLPAQHRTEIYAMNSDGSSNATLTRGAPGFDQPSWSPDGNSIAFVANPYSTSSIEVANADGTGVHRVSPQSWTSYSPTWTPDGKIVFLRQTGFATQNAGAPTSAYIVNPDGSDLRLLYPKLNASQIAWGSATLAPVTCPTGLLP